MSDRPASVLAAFAAVCVLAVAAVPGASSLVVEVCVLALLGLSLELVLRPLGTAALFQPGVMAVSAWGTATLLGRNQSPLIALGAALVVGGVLPLACLAGRRHGRAGVALAGLALALLLTGLAPPAPSFLPPVFLGVALGTPRAAAIAAVAALAAGVWLRETAMTGDLWRWLVVSRETPDLLPRAGVSLNGVRGAALGLAGLLAGLAGWAAAIGSLGTPGARGIDPAVVFAWLLVPLAGGPGLAGTLAGAALFAAVARGALAVGVPALALAAPLAAALIWRHASARVRSGASR